MQKHNELYIPKPLFVTHKNEFKKLLDTRLYHIASLYWEQEMSIKDIATEYTISITRIRQLLFKAKFLFQEDGYKVE